MLYSEAPSVTLFVFLARSAWAQLVAANLWEVARPLGRGKFGDVHATLLQRARLKEAKLPVSFLVIILIIFSPVHAVKQDEVFRVYPRVFWGVDRNTDDLIEVRKL